MTEEAHSYLEPKVAKLESNVEALTRDVQSLSTSINDLGDTVKRQGEQTNQQIQGLMVAVTSASGPRKTDWHLLVSLGLFTLAIGAIVFAPLQSRMSVHEHQADGIVARFDEHNKLQLHPVGASRIEALEVAMREKATANTIAIKELDVKLQNEYQLLNKNLEVRIAAADVRLQQEIGVVQKQVEEVKNNGSPITRERLSVIEEKLKGTK